MTNDGTYGKYPPVTPVDLNCEPLKAVCSKDKTNPPTGSHPDENYSP